MIVRFDVRCVGGFDGAKFVPVDNLQESLVQKVLLVPSKFFKLVLVERRSCGLERDEGSWDNVRGSERNVKCGGKISGDWWLAFGGIGWVRSAAALVTHDLINGGSGNFVVVSEILIMWDKDCRVSDDVKDDVDGALSIGCSEDAAW